MNNRLLKQILSLIMAAAIMVSILPASAIAQEVVIADEAVLGAAEAQEVEKDQTDTSDKPETVQSDETPPPQADSSTKDETEKTEPEQDAEKGQTDTSDKQETVQSDEGTLPDSPKIDETEIIEPEPEEWIGIEYLNRNDEWIGIIPDGAVIPETDKDATTSAGSDTSADVETSADWEKTIPYNNLTGNAADDLITVALSQLGYRESTKNYVLSANNKHKGYTRYGEWYGVPYGDWCAMFASFCLNYAGISKASFPRSSSCTSWISSLTSLHKFVDSDYDPKPGDLVFFRFGKSGISDHVGIVYSLYTENSVRKIKVIEGNSSDKVQIVTYPMTSSKIVGYGLLTDTIGPDFTSKRLLVVTGDTEILTKGELLGQYGSARLLSFETAEETESAYYYYKTIADAVAPDIQVNDAAEGAIAADIDVNKENNPLTLLNDLLKTESENVVRNAKLLKDNSKTADTRPLIALIDTAVTDTSVEAYSVIASEAETNADTTSDTPSENGDTAEAENTAPTHGDDMLSFIRSENADAHIISIEALDADGKGSVSAVYAAVRLAMSKGAKVINMSLSAYSTEANAVLESVINDAVELGITVVVSAGNDGKNAKYFTPANVASAITVGSCDADGTPLTVSNYGDSVDYYVVSATTSEAAARFTGMISLSETLPDFNDTLNGSIGTKVFANSAVETPAEDDTLSPLGTDDTFTAAEYPSFSDDDIASSFKNPETSAGTCNWKIDKDGNMVIWPSSGDAGVLPNVVNSATNPWNDFRTSIKTIRFEGNISTSRGCVRLFGSCPNLTEIDFTGFDMSNAGNCCYMFENDTNLKYVDFSNSNASSPYNLTSMFNGCSSIEYIDFPMLRGNQHKGSQNMQSGYMNNIFGGCSMLKSLNLSGLETEAVTSFNDLFLGCPNLEYLDISNMSNADLQYMNSMLSPLTMLKELNMSGFDSGKSTSFEDLFASCIQLETADLSNMPNAYVTTMKSMFKGMKNLKVLDLTGFKTDRVINMSYMFQNCGSLLGTSYEDVDEFGEPVTKWKLDLTSFNTSSVTNLGYMFENCYELTDIDFSSFNTYNCTDFGRMFRSCISLTELDLSSFTTNKSNFNSIIMNFMLQYCYGLVKLDLSNPNFYTPNTAGSLNASLIFNSSLEEIKIGSGISLVSTDLNNFMNFPEGLWQHQESRKIYNNTQLSFEIWSKVCPNGTMVNIDRRIQIMREYAGTYKKIYPIPSGLDYIPDVNIEVFNLNEILPEFSQKGNKFVFTPKSGTDFSVTTNGSVTAAKNTYTNYSSESDSFSLTYKSDVDNGIIAAKSIYGDVYDVELTFNKIRIFNSSATNNIGVTIVGGDRGVKLSATLSPNSGNIDVEYDVTVKLINRSPEAAAAKNAYNASHAEQVDDSVVWEKDPDGNYLAPLVGAYLFGSYDLDVRSLRSLTNADGSSDKHNKYSEGFYLGNGFYFNDNPDLSHRDSVVVSDDTVLYHTYVKTDGTSQDYHNNLINDAEFLGKYAIHGTRSDYESMSSGFIAKADSSEASFIWTSTRGANTTIFAAFSLKIFDVEKISPDGKPLAGASFKIQKGQINPVTGEVTYSDLTKVGSQWTTDGTPYSYALVPGAYRLVELDAPDYYKEIEPIYFSVSTNKELVRAGHGVVENLVAIDPLEKSCIKLAKYDSEYPTMALKGMTFTLTGTSDKGTAVNETADSDSEGYCSFNNIPVGTYTLTETKAPVGYKLPDDPWIMKIHEYEYAEIIDKDGNVSGGSFNDFIHGLFSLANTATDSMIISKEVVGASVGDGVFTFTININNSDGTPYVIENAALSQISNLTYSTSDKTYTLTLRDGETAVIPLPQGADYTVTEVRDKPYKPTIERTQSGVVDTIDGATASGTYSKGVLRLDYTNTYDTIDITVRKSWIDVSNANSTRPDDLTVHLRLTDTSGTISDTEYTTSDSEWSGWTKTGDIWSGTFHIPSYGDAIEYKVWEEAPVGYIGGYVTEQTAAAVGNTNSVELENRISYNLSIEKVVYDEENKFPGKKFDFTLTLKNSDGTPYTETVNAPSGATDWSGTDGVYTFKLGAQDSVTLTLPIAVRYSVNEAYTEGFQTDWQVTYTEAGTVKSDKEKTNTVSERPLLSDHSVVYYNLTQEELPAAGGFGIPIPATVCAASLFALLLIWYYKRRWVIDR